MDVEEALRPYSPCGEAYIASSWLSCEGTDYSMIVYDEICTTQ